MTMMVDPDLKRSVHVWHEDHALWLSLAERLDALNVHRGMHMDPLIREVLDLGSHELVAHLRLEHQHLLPVLEALDPVLAEDARVDQAVLRNAAHAVVHFVSTRQDPRRAIGALASGLRAHARLHEGMPERLKDAL